MTLDRRGNRTVPMYCWASSAHPPTRRRGRAVSASLAKQSGLVVVWWLVGGIACDDCSTRGRTAWLHVVPAADRPSYKYERDEGPAQRRNRQWAMDAQCAGGNLSAHACTVYLVCVFACCRITHAVPVLLPSLLSPPSNPPALHHVFATPNR